MSMHPEVNYFKEYKGDCKVFIETGTFKGDGVQLAIDAMFLNIHSVDIVSQPVTYKYPGYGEIKLHIGNSPYILSVLLPEIQDKCMFWLDAHSQQLEGEQDNYPLLKELEVIGRHPRKDHVIMIDDMLMMTHPDVTGWSRSDIEAAVKAINPKYKITYLSNPIINNILLATL